MEETPNLDDLENLESIEEFQNTAGITAKNIWTKMLVEPNAALHFAVQRMPDKYTHMLLLAAGLSGALGYEGNPQTQRIMVMLMMIPVSIIILYCAVLVNTFLIAHIGKWFSGQAGVYEVRKVFAWAYWPMIIGAPLGLIELVWAIFLDVNPTTNTYSPVFVNASIAFTVVRLALVIWSIVLVIKGLMIVHKFGVWQAIGTVFMCGVILLFVIMMLSLGIFLLSDFATDLTRSIQ